MPLDCVKITFSFSFALALMCLSFGKIAQANTKELQPIIKPLYASNPKNDLSNIRSSQVANGIEQSESTKQKDFSGAFAELASIFALGRVAYSLGGETIERDFDYEIEGNDFEYFAKRLFTDEYLKLDDNTKGMNWGHAYAGMIYHQSFRNHNFSYYESVLATFASSTVWEVVFEYKEVVSINDQFFTTWGGAVLGESFFQIGNMLSHKEGYIPATFELLFNPAKAIRSIWNENKLSTYALNKKRDTFSVYSGLTYASHKQRDLNKAILLFGINAKVDNFDKANKKHESEPRLLELDAEFGFASTGFEDFQLASKVLLAGKLKTTKNTQKSFAHSYYIGPSTGMEYASFGADEDSEDFFASVHLIGLDMASKWQKQDWLISLRASIYADFSMVKPFATQGVENYRDFFWNTKSSLWENAYAYALGHTFDLSLQAKYKAFSFGLKWRSQAWDSIDNKEYERYSDWNPNNKDLDFKDRRDRIKLSLQYDYSDTMRLGLNLSQIRRQGEFFGIDDPSFYASAKDAETRTGLEFHYQY